MARRVFFSFHHQEDSWRIGQVRNSWLLQRGSTNSFLDSAEWEAVERKGNAAVKSWINQELHNTGVTVVLIGKNTASRPWVKYEIEESYKRGNGLLGIRIHGVKDQDGKTSTYGRNPLDDVEVDSTDFMSEWWGLKTTKKLSEIFQTYDWVSDNGRKYMPDWIETAAQRAGR
jgi:hypothetical protein